MGTTSLTRNEIVKLYHELKNRRERIVSIESIIVGTYNVMISLYGWDVAKRVYDGHSALLGLLSMEYYRIGDKMNELEEL